MSRLEFWHWVPAWHWVLPALALAIIMVTIGARLILAEERRRLDGVEWDTDWQREPETEQDAYAMIDAWHNDLEVMPSEPRDWRGLGHIDLPGPMLPAPDGARARAGELHLEPWHERGWWDDPDLTVWDAKQQAARCWEILHIEFPRLRAELGIAA